MFRRARIFPIAVIAWLDVLTVALFPSTSHAGSPSRVGIDACRDNAGAVAAGACLDDLACADNRGAISKKACQGNGACLLNQGPVGAGACQVACACAESAGEVGEAGCVGA